MDIAIIVPLRIGACGGAIKHLAQILPFWTQYPKVHSVCIYVPEGIEAQLALPATTICSFPTGDYRHSYASLCALIQQKQHDVALIITARHIAIPNIAVVTMVRNAEPIQHADYPMSLYWQARLWAYRREHRGACKRAKRVLAVSNYVKQQVIKIFDIESDRVDVVYHGFHSEEATAESKAIPNTMPGFLFTAGVLAPYRGIEDIIYALAELKRNGIAHPSLVIAGSSPGKDSSYEKGLRRLAAKLGIESKIKWAGQLSRQEMTWCYQHCQAFLFTSRAEACPNIVLESMGHGAVCISCDHDPMPEIYGDAALFYPWGNGRMLADRIKVVMAMDEASCLDLRQKGLARIREFTWKRTAAQTLQVLQKAIDTYS